MDLVLVSVVLLALSGLQRTSAAPPGSTVHVRAGEDATLRCPLLDGSNTTTAGVRAGLQVGLQVIPQPTVSWYRKSAGRGLELLVSFRTADGSKVLHGDGVSPDKVSAGPDGALRLRGSDRSDSAVYYCGVSHGSERNKDPEPEPKNHN